MAICREFYFPSSDGSSRIHAAEWMPESGEIIGVLQIAHGVAEYGMRYAPFAEFMTEHGFAVVANDHLGHGLSAEKDADTLYFGPCDGWKHVVDDMYALRCRTKEKYPDVPYFLMGHSMGSFLTRTYLIRYPGTVDAAICCLDSLNYLTNHRDVQRTFQRLHLFISPGGLLAFDVRLPERLAALDGQVFLDETEDTYCVWRTEYRRGLCTYYMDLFTLAEDGSWDRSFELHRQRGYSVEQLTRWLEEAGFADVRTWGDGKLRRPVPGEDRVYFTCIRK